MILSCMDGGFMPIHSLHVNNYYTLPVLIFSPAMFPCLFKSEIQGCSSDVPVRIRTTHHFDKSSLLKQHTESCVHIQKHGTRVFFICIPHKGQGGKPAGHEPMKNSYCALVSFPLYSVAAVVHFRTTDTIIASLL